jgi:hypothetical protein
VIKGVHNLLFVNQQVFLGLKQRIQKFVAEKSQKELEHWRAQLLFNDWKTIYAQGRADFDKVKDDLDVALLFMQDPSKNLMCTNGVLVEFVDDTTKYDHVS